MSAWRRQRRPPLWFVALVALVVALVVRRQELAGAGADGVRLAFFAWLVIVAEWVWTGIQALGHFTLVALEWMINALWITVREIGAGIKAFGVDFLQGMKKSWQFLRATYQRVLRPAWLKFWRAVDWARRSLERLFRPVFEFLRRVRLEFLKFYEHWVRPILDSIDVARKVVRVFAQLGLDWARRLDFELARLQERIDAPFQFVLRKINEVINLVNRVVTLDGLIQRLALIRSIERDIREVSRAFMNWRHHPLTVDDYDLVKHRANARTLDDVQRDTADFLLTSGGAYEPFVSEMLIAWRHELERQ